MRTVEEVIKQYKHICWYPSAGNDFRPLLYLSDWYYQHKSIPLDDGQEMPDLFIFSDVKGLFSYYPQIGENAYDQIRSGYFEDGACLLRHSANPEKYTEITVKSFEPLNALTLSKDPSWSGSDIPLDYNSAYVFEVNVYSKKDNMVNQYAATVLYIAALNESFVFEFLLPKRIRIEYLVLIRYAGFYNGNRVEPYWILDRLRDFRTKYLVSCTRYVTEAEVDKKGKDFPHFDEIYTIYGEGWSQYGKDSWYRLS